MNNENNNFLIVQIISIVGWFTQTNTKQTDHDNITAHVYKAREGGGSQSFQDTGLEPLKHKLNMSCLNIINLMHWEVY